MKIYIVPNTKIVALDANQAIIQACAVNGIYINGTTTLRCGTSSALGPPCQHTPKGATAGNTGMYIGTLETSSPSS